MHKPLIGPDELEADAVVPQCLDNQFVSDRVFARMTEQKVDFRDREIARLREDDFRTEFVRSLVYSSQVVIQRAWLNNSDFLYKNFEPENGAGLNAFAALVRAKAVVPYLFRESSLSDSLEFDLSKSGDRATKALLAEIGDDVTCVRLAADDAANQRATASMETRFGSKITAIRHMDEAQRNAMAAELFADRERLQQPGAWTAFDQALDALARYAFEKPDQLRKSNKQLSRNIVYKDNFVVDQEDAVVNGRFRSPDGANPFLFELKKFVDLVYNTNLPDRLKRYTFTPVNMPSRMALQDDPGEGYTADQVNSLLANGDALDSIRRTFMAHTQKAMSLPLLRDLTIADVQEIRALPEWESFKQAQTRILRDPLHCLDQMEPFQSHFDRFQWALSDWYNTKYERARTQERYCSYVSLAVSTAGKLFVAGSKLDPWQKTAVLFAGDRIVEAIPKKVKGWAAKLMVGVYDIGKQQLDADRTYTIELAQTSAEIAREDILNLLQEINRRGGDGMPQTPGQVADQGIQ